MGSEKGRKLTMATFTVNYLIASTNIIQDWNSEKYLHHATHPKHKKPLLIPGYAFNTTAVVLGNWKYSQMNIVRYIQCWIITASIYMYMHFHRTNAELFWKTWTLGCCIVMWLIIIMLHVYIISITASQGIELTSISQYWPFFLKFWTYLEVVKKQIQ